MNELIGKIKVDFIAPKIEYDLAEMQARTEEIIKPYVGYIIQNEEEVASAKKVVANLNATAKSISDQRIACVKEISVPISAFETAIKGFCAKITDTASKISEQVKTYETAEKERKRAEILALPDYAAYIIFDERWLNKTYTTEMIQKDLAAQKATFQTNCAIIKTNAEIGGLDSADYLNALANGSPIDQITATMKHDHDLLSKLSPSISPTPALTMDADPTIYTRTWTVKGTKAQLLAVKEFLDKIGVKYEKIESK